MPMFQPNACLSQPLFFSSLSSPPGRAQSVDEIVAKYVAAAGGAKKWKSARSMAVDSRSESFSFDLFWHHCFAIASLIDQHLVNWDRCCRFSLPEHLYAPTMSQRQTRVKKKSLIIVSPLLTG